MPPSRKLTPSYLLHRQSGRGRVVWTDHTGARQQKLLPGPFGSPESLAAKARLELELVAPSSAAVTARNGVTVAEVLVAYLVHADRYYRDPDGKPGSEVVSLKRSIKPVRELYADLSAVEFGPKALAVVRQSMVRAGLCRSLINKRIDRVKRVFKWAASEELVPVTTYEALRTLAGLRRGRTEAKESEPVQPIDDETVRATLPHLPHYIRVMVELLWHTGMRPSEVVAMTLDRIDRSVAPWVYRPAHHKTAHRGKARAIPLGPNARAVLTAFLVDRSLTPDAPLFSPKRARDERFEQLRLGRKTKVQPSQVSRKKTNPKRKPSERYTAHAITQAVAIATEKAGVSHWHPYQLRHTFGTKARKLFGLEHAGAALGHTKMSATEVYAQRDSALAVEVAAKIG
ncbi:catalytic phage domain protein : Integrase family protein OS=Planctomyces limnophilus (strain ATCC 43296 / DSM 3776 / IFAM 1008 / 290) GN=Plim_1106 PE=4 SV=1: Phage_integrase [Gemmata massiliana]|uniref:Tyr recombinase domain-containing protein n=1 Tax=Gemmata massiliana TaxID=1210884 RepID=A0A6P2DI56_9BACT|nr:site-specific integrase [Gemmata massiliana]VTS01860.1 catalytic phage domain protein : Integrase family protein OS=Planctomyces limnophilus (strain ATCC 43296 / DSM 3776 / IFAM 1008 / 290) GN=Plim_1106 PE=4 SV=1: Phage_integrase [Gemmata massiliana]